MILLCLSVVFCVTDTAALKLLFWRFPWIGWRSASLMKI